MSLYFALKTVENNKNKKSVKFQGDMLNHCNFNQVFVFTTNHHLNCVTILMSSISDWVFKLSKRFQCYNRNLFQLFFENDLRIRLCM